MNISLSLDPPRDAQQVLLAVERVVIRPRPDRRLAFDRLVAGTVEVAFEHAFAAFDGFVVRSLREARPG